MTTLLFVLNTLAHVVGLIFALRLFTRNRNPYTFLAILVVFALAYDNLIIALGNVLGEGPTLESLSAFRFYAHALFTPLLIIFGWGVVRRVNDTWGQSKLWHGVFCTIALGLIILGIISDVIGLHLAPVIDAGVLRYTHAVSSGPPIPAILTIIILIGLGAHVWKRTGWPAWLFIGSVLMFIAAGVGASVSFVIGNVGEAILMLSIVASDYQTTGQQLPRPSNDNNQMVGAAG